MPFFGPVSLGGGDPSASGTGTYDELLARLMQEFPGLQGGATPANQTTASLGFSSPGVNLYSGQPASGGGLYGSTGTSLFEGAAAGAPESITGGLSSGYLGRSPSQAPLSNTGQPGTAPNISFPTGPLGSSSGNAPFSYLGAPGASESLGGGATPDLMGAPMQQYEQIPGYLQVTEGGGGSGEGGGGTFGQPGFNVAGPPTATGFNPGLVGAGINFVGQALPSGFAPLSTMTRAAGAALGSQSAANVLGSNLTSNVPGNTFGNPVTTIPGPGPMASFQQGNYFDALMGLIGVPSNTTLSTFASAPPGTNANLGTEFEGLAPVTMPVNLPAALGDYSGSMTGLGPNAFSTSTGGGYRAGGLSYFSGLPAGPTGREAGEPTSNPPAEPTGLIGLDPTGQEGNAAPGPAPGIDAVSGPGPGTPGNPSGEEGGGGAGGAGDGSLLCNFCLGHATGDAGETAAQRRAFDGLAKRAFAANPALKRSFVHYQKASRAIIARMEALPPDRKKAALRDLHERLVTPFYAAAQQRDVRGAARILRGVVLRLANTYGVPVPKEHILASESHLGPVHAR